ncbi:polyprenyl synthetase family protein [Candidatus Omnitrophota bacterium]
MFYKIKRQLNKELKKLIRKSDRLYSLSKISPLLFKNLQDFVLRDGKRIRPILFVIGYKGFAKRVASNLFASALSIELLHDFLLVHDDIIDKSDTRRGKPAMHTMFNRYCNKYKNIKFNGQDLAIIAGDILYAMSIDAFLSIKEKSERKEKALKRFIMSTVQTGGGEFIELIYGVNDIDKITEKDILRVYDYKTAYYTFSAPLSIGAMLAGANKNQINKLTQYGLYLGRAFQIKDDVISMFRSIKEIGKSQLADLQESKKTLLLWHTYHNSNKKDKLLIKKILSKKSVNKSDLFCMRRIMKTSGTLDYAKREISKLIEKSKDIIASSVINKKYKNLLCDFSDKLLHL